MDRIKSTDFHLFCAVILLCSDFYEYNFLTQQWYALETAFAPRARYRATAVTIGNKLILFGGHDGLRHLNDTCIFNFESKVFILQQLICDASFDKF